MTSSTKVGILLQTLVLVSIVLMDRVLFEKGFIQKVVHRELNEKPISSREGVI